MTNILLTGFHFDGWHGSMLHICEISNYLTKKGYHCFGACVTMTPEIKEYALQHGLKLYLINTLPLDQEYQIIWAYHYPILASLIHKGLKYQKIHVGCLSSFSPIEVLPDYYQECHFVSAVSKEAQKVLVERYHFDQDKIKVIPNFLPDEYVLTPTKPSKKLKKIAVVSNHPPQEVRELKNFFKEGIIDYYGYQQQYYTPITPDILKQYDCVISIGKTVIYALGMGIPVFEYDHFGGCGYISEQNYLLEENSNYSGRGTRQKYEPFELYQQLVDGYQNARRETKKLKKIAKERYLLSTQVDHILNAINQQPPHPISVQKYALFLTQSQALIDYCLLYLNQIGSLSAQERQPALATETPASFDKKNPADFLDRLKKLFIG